MGPVKRVLLGSAAGVFAVAGAQAADLPVKAQPVEYVKVCSLYGAGFWYVPGTDTCIKIGGYTKLQTNYNMASTGPGFLGMANNAAGDAGGRNNRLDTSPFNFNGRGLYSFDLRSQTEYGTLRSYVDGGLQSASSDAAPTTQFSANTFLNTRAFVQFAGFTLGRMRSFFDLYFQGNYAFAGQRFGNDTSPNGIMGYAYTWQFGGGLSASVSLEDNGQAGAGRGRTTVNLSAPAFSPPVAVGGSTTFSAVTYDNKGQEFYDPVVNLRLDQAWGFVGASAALHDASGAYYAGGTLPNTVFEGNGHPGDKYGWAATVGFTLTNVFGLQGDTVAGQGVYSVGAAGYATPDLGPMLAFGAGLNLGMGFLNEAVFTTGSNVELTTVWSFNAAYEHRWDPKWRTSIYGGMIGVEYDGAAKQMWCNAPGGKLNTVAFSNSFTNVSNCDPNWSLSEVGSRTLWNPVPDLDVGFDVVWYHLNTAFAGTGNLVAIGAKPAGQYTISNQDAIGAVFRVQRNFLY
jgi:Porin subfamily